MSEDNKDTKNQDSQQKNCYLGVKGKKYGPTTEKAIRLLYEQKKIPDSALFIRTGMNEWVPLLKSGVVDAIEDNLPPLPANDIVDDNSEPLEENDDSTQRDKSNEENVMENEASSQNPPAQKKRTVFFIATGIVLFAVLIFGMVFVMINNLSHSIGKQPTANIAPLLEETETPFSMQTEEAKSPSDNNEFLEAGYNYYRNDSLNFEYIYPNTFDISVKEIADNPGAFEGYCRSTESASESASITFSFDDFVISKLIIPYQEDKDLDDYVKSRLSSALPGGEFTDMKKDSDRLFSGRINDGNNEVFCCTELQIEEGFVKKQKSVTIKYPLSKKEKYDVLISTIVPAFRYLYDGSEPYAYHVTVDYGEFEKYDVYGGSNPEMEFLSRRNDEAGFEYIYPADFLETNLNTYSADKRPLQKLFAPPEGMGSIGLYLEDYSMDFPSPSFDKDVREEMVRRLLLEDFPGGEITWLERNIYSTKGLAKDKKEELYISLEDYVLGGVVNKRKMVFASYPLIEKKRYDALISKVESGFKLFYPMPEWRKNIEYYEYTEDGLGFKFLMPSFLSTSIFDDIGGENGLMLIEGPGILSNRTSLLMSSIPQMDNPLGKYFDSYIDSDLNTYTPTNFKIEYINNYDGWSEARITASPNPKDSQPISRIIYGYSRDFIHPETQFPFTWFFAIVSDAPLEESIVEVRDKIINSFELVDYNAYYN